MVGRTLIQLPLFLRAENKYRVGIAFYIVAALLYITSNRFPFFEPVQLPMTAFDQWVPFVPWAVWIYISEYIYFPMVYITCKDLDNANKYLYSFLALQTVSVIIFWIWPTTFPRDLFPLSPEATDPLTYFAFSTLRSWDTPNNCIPSLHVSSVYLSAFIFLDDQRKKFPFFFFWGTLIALSTLPTKQHYLVDLVAGLAMAVLFYWVFHRWVGYRRK